MVSGLADKKAMRREWRSYAHDYAIQLVRESDGGGAMRRSVQKYPTAI